MKRAKSKRKYGENRAKMTAKALKICMASVSGGYLAKAGEGKSGEIG